jgi:hypothetical protein
MTWLAIVVAVLFVFAVLDHGAAAVVKQPANAWSDEVVPAAVDPEIAQLVDYMNTPEPWDHNWYVFMNPIRSVSLIVARDGTFTRTLPICALHRCWL